MQALIIGAGIGGTTAALALARRGIEALVFEQAPRLFPLGAGLSLWSNASACLAEIGLLERLVEQGAPIETGEIRTQGGAVLGRVSVGEFSRGLGFPSFCVRRGVLQVTLAGALPGGVLNLDHRLVDFTQDAREVVARFHNGRETRGDVLVGADGLRSLVRGRVVGDGPPRYAGYGGWLGLTPFRHDLLPEGLAVESWGRGARFGMLHCGGGEVYWFAARNRRTPPDGARPGRKRDVLDLARGWHEPIAELVEATDEARIVELPFFDRDPSRRWGEGRVTLLGDAAHPMTPNIGQGACQAIEDALVLADCLQSSAQDPAAGLRLYERRRMPRTAKLVRQSRRLGRLVQSESRAVGWLRDWLVRLTPPRVHLRQIAEHLCR